MANVTLAITMRALIILIIFLDVENGGSSLGMKLIHIFYILEILGVGCLKKFDS